jgi:hypothetical protein
MASFVVWWGGFSPAARYLVPLLPFCAAAVAWSPRAPAPPPCRHLAAQSVQVPITAYAWQHPRSLWPVGTSNPLLDALGPVGRAYEYLLPPLTNGQPLLPAVVFLAVVLGLNVLLVASSNSRRVRSGNRSIA